MSDYLSQIKELEEEFSQELRGYGSLSMNLAGGSAEENEYLGFDLRPEDIEALYFDGIHLPRWESIEEENHDRKLEIYNQSMQKILAAYPLIGRVSDTDQKIKFMPDEVSALLQECETVLETVDDAKAIKALQKFAIASRKALENQKGLLLIPT